MFRINNNRISRHFVLWLTAFLLIASCSPFSRAQPARAGVLEPIQFRSDQGGAVVINGEVRYTNAFFTLGVAQPMIILEDQAGFVDRNRRFIQSPESQTLGQITSDFYESPFSFSLSLPLEPRGSLRDVDNDGRRDTGVMIYAVAYWTNIFGDPYLEERDLQGGGWSTAYSSVTVTDAGDERYEVDGGKFLVYAADDQQGFPSDFGADGKLFTADDPTALLPSGYTVVDLDTSPFTFDRSRQISIDLIEPQALALDDFSDLGYVSAFDAMIEKMRKEYAFSEYKGIDWDAKKAEFRPRFESAQSNGDRQAYLRALSDFAMSIPDGHIGGPSLTNDFLQATSGGLGMVIRTLDDGRTIVTYLSEGGPAQKAGIALRAQVTLLDDKPIEEALAATVPWSGPFSNDTIRQLQQLRYVLRSPIGSKVEISYVNPGQRSLQTSTLTSIDEDESFTVSSFNAGTNEAELPVSFEVLDSGFGYVKIHSFSDNELLTVQLWERMISKFKDEAVSGIIIDMRQNNGGNGFLADQMAAYFFDKPLELGNTSHYDDKLGDFYFDQSTVDRFILPPPELRYQGRVAVLIGPSCQSACEFFSYDMTLEERATIIGQYATAGLGGSVDQFLMPEGEYFQFTVGRATDMDGEIHIEGKGVEPTVRVPVSEETLFGDGDPVLDAAIAHLDR